MSHKSTKALNKIAGAVPASHSHPDSYQVQDAMSTIARAEQYKKDKPLMREVKKLAKSICK